MILEKENKNLLSIKESTDSKLNISFIKTIDDKDFGIPNTTHDIFQDKIKLTKILKTILSIKEKTVDSLINSRKNSEAGTEKINIDKFNWCNHKIKNYLLECGTSKKYFVVRAGDSRILGYIENNIFYLICIEYTLNTIYKH
ncbi:hypothetical protein [Campylobacter hyointestinalis]|uniref:hypothetical protein n=1 Tax=Campylobacter hyointestinalis TaxID=198 RepID=UPI0011AC39E5|nr:hypothetical protein [Campylobacter hyointestinalis]TWO18732.1 hypothetical protein YZ80_08560 [Campylobacter hyointestinalis]